MEVDIEKMLTEWAPTSSRDMYLNMVADALGKASHNTTHTQQQIQIVTVTNTALGAGLIHSIVANSA